MRTLDPRGHTRVLLSHTEVRLIQEALDAADLEHLSFRSSASHPDVVYMNITTEGHHSVLFSPNTQPGDERSRHLGHA